MTELGKKDLDASEMECEYYPTRYGRAFKLVFRNQKHVRDLKKLYKGLCRVTGRPVLDGIAGDLTESHHIEWLSKGGADEPGNMILVSPDIHAAIHASEGRLEWEKGRPVLIIGERQMPLAINNHLKPRK